jgi:hypothetical protein
VARALDTAALLAYVGFRAYFSPEFLFHFSNSFYC